MYGFQLPSASDVRSAPRTYPPRTSRLGPHLHLSANPSLRVCLYVPHRRVSHRLVTLVALLACGALVVCFACAQIGYSRRGTVDPSHLGLVLLASLTHIHVVHGSQRTTSEGSDAPLIAPYVSYKRAPASHQLDITFDCLDEPETRLGTLRADHTINYLAYLPHSGLHNQRIAYENALTLARLLNRTLLVPPARLGSKTLRYVRSSTLSRMLRLSDKRQGRSHCARIPADVPQPDECVDYMAYTLVPWAWLVNLGPIEAEQALVRTSNGTEAWIEEWLGVGPDETLFFPDTEPYEYQFADTLAPAREGDKFLHTIPIDTLATAPQRLIQLGTLFGSSRLRLRKAENQRVRGEVRRHMVFANAVLTLAAERIGQVLGGTYVGVHVRMGDGRFQKGARANVRLVWWKLVHDVLGLDTQTALELERDVLFRMGEAIVTHGEDDETDGNGMLGPPEVSPDAPSLRVPHPPLAPLPATFSPQLSCRSQPHVTPSLRRLNVPLFIATDAPHSLDDPLLAPLTRVFPCAFTLGSFGAETADLEQLRNGYDGVHLGGFLAPIMDAMVMGGAWAVVGTEGSTFSRYVEDVLWRVTHGWPIVQRG